MSDVSKTEVKDMIETAVEAKVATAVSKGLDEFMKKYQLGPEQLVWLAQKHRIETAQNTLIRRLIISSVVSSVIFLLGFGLSAYLKI